MTSDRFDTVIIGAGIIGCAIALALSRKGYRTLNVDRNPAVGYGSTSASAAIIRPYYSTPEGTALAYESHFYWQEWRTFLDAAPDELLADYIQCGCMVLMTPQGDHLAATRALLSEAGVPHTILDADALERAIPTMNLQSFTPPKRIDDPEFGAPNENGIPGAVFTPVGGYINDPMLACRNLQHAAMAHGATFRFGAEIIDILRAGNRVTGVKTADGGVIEAPIVINVAGPHSSVVNDMAGVSASMSIQTRALRQEVVHVAAPDGLDFEKSGLVITDADAGVYFRPEIGNHMLIGSLEPSCDTLEWVQPDTYSPALSEQWTNQAWRAAQRFQTLGLPNRAQGYVALYDVSSDWIPIYDKSDLDGYFMAIGTSGNQFKNAPVVGEMMAGLVEYSLAGHDNDVAPMPFHLRHLDRPISMAFFSRRRPVNADSSFSVLG